MCVLVVVNCDRLSALRLRLKPDITTEQWTQLRDLCKQNNHLDIIQLPFVQHETAHVPPPISTAITSTSPKTTPVKAHPRVSMTATYPAVSLVPAALAMISSQPSGTTAPVSTNTSTPASPLATALVELSTAQAAPSLLPVTQSSTNAPISVPPPISASASQLPAFTAIQKSGTTVVGENGRKRTADVHDNNLITKRLNVR